MSSGKSKKQRFVPANEMRDEVDNFRWEEESPRERTPPEFTEEVDQRLQYYIIQANIEREQRY